VLLSCKQSDIAEVRNLLHGRGITSKDILLVFISGQAGIFTERRWPAEYFATLADKLADNFSAAVSLPV